MENEYQVYRQRANAEPWTFLSDRGIAAQTSLENLARKIAEEQARNNHHENTDASPVSIINNRGIRAGDCRYNPTTKEIVQNSPLKPEQLYKLIFYAIKFEKELREARNPQP